jgi:putative ABC transport system permease protein
MMMHVLDKKMLRDLWGIKGQVVAICLVISAGIGTFVMSLSTLESLQWSKDAYYERYRFADVFAHVKRAPLSLAARISEIPGVAKVQTRIVTDVSLSVPGMKEPAVGRLISVPDTTEPKLNTLHLRKGRYIAPGRFDEALVSESFADAHQFEPGDTVAAVINGRLQNLRIVGVVLSPEYIIQIPAGSLMPDDRRFGVFWMGYDGIAAALDMDGAFNNVTLQLMPGASEPEVIDRLDQLTEPYGSTGAYGRSDHVSHTYISDEIRQLRSMALIGPTIFLGVAAFLMNIVLTRLIATQREQIAAMKAFGLTRWEIGFHYLKMVSAIPVIGALLGTGIGSWMGLGITRMYTRFYRFPVFGFDLDPGVVGLALLISVSAALVGTMASVRRAVMLPPAEAMRPEPPAKFRKTLFERFGWGRGVPQTVRMIVRQLERRPLKSAISCLGIATGVAVMVLGSFMKDSIVYVMDFQFRLAQRQDMMISFVEPSGSRAIHDVAHLPGVFRVEPFRAVPCRLKLSHRERRVSIMGLDSSAALYRLMDDQEQVVELPEEGLLLSSKLASLLDAELGDIVTVEVLEGERGVYQVPVSAMITEFNGTNAYMNRTALSRMLHEGDNASGAFLSIDPLKEDELFAELKQTPRAAGVAIKSAILKSFEQTIAENLLRMRLFNIGFAAIIACGVVYNTARISLSERSRELATLRVIGFTRREISTILLGELAILTALAIPVGLGIGYLFAAWATLGMDTELYRIPLVIERATYGEAALTVIVATVASGLWVRRKLDHLDLVAVLKSKE